MRALKIIGGILLIILGIIIYDELKYYDERCHSLWGELGQALNEDTRQACQNLQIGTIVSGIFILTGLALILIGSLKGKQNNRKFKEIKENFSTESSAEREDMTSHYPLSIDYTNNLINENNDKNDYLSRLEKLDEMKKNGTITQEEFNILKSDILKRFENISIENIKYKTYESSTHNFKIKYPSHWNIIDENLNPPEVLRISTSLDSLFFHMTISLKNPLNEEEKEVTEENLKIICKDMLVEAYEFAKQDRDFRHSNVILEAQTYIFKGYNVHKVIAESKDNKKKIFFSILIGVKFSEDLTSILDYDKNKNKIKIFRIVSSYAQKDNSIFLSIFDRIIESIEFNEYTTNNSNKLAN